MQGDLQMFDERSSVELIERAHDATPFCMCGRHTTPVERDGRIWLECSSLDERPDGTIARVLSTITAGAHTRQVILDLRPIAA